MLCQPCADIELQIDEPEANVEVRRYHNLRELKKTVSKCELCALLYQEAKKIEHSDWVPYCRRSWGDSLYEELLVKSPIRVYHRASRSEHNLYWTCVLDASSIAEYQGGPTFAESGRLLGGIFVESGKSIL